MTSEPRQPFRLLGELKHHAPNIDPVTLDVLADMYSASHLWGAASDQPVKLDCDTRISIAQGAQINRIVRESATRNSLEIGFAYGFSTLWILDAMRGRPSARHVAIDPFELTTWGGVGLQQVKRLSVAAHFEWLEEYSMHVLPKLMRAGERFDFIFIDGNHRFDDALVDFYLCDRLLDPGGIVAFDDVGMPSIHSVINFVLTNRQYKVIQQPAGNMLALRKLADDKRDWFHFKGFKVINPGRQRMIAALKQNTVRLSRATGTEKMLREIQTTLTGKVK